jgi:hypothetical protein
MNSAVNLQVRLRVARWQVRKQVHLASKEFTWNMALGEFDPRGRSTESPGRPCAPAQTMVLTCAALRSRSTLAPTAGGARHRRCAAPRPPVMTRSSLRALARCGRSSSEGSGRVSSRYSAITADSGIVSPSMSGTGMRPIGNLSRNFVRRRLK